MFQFSGYPTKTGDLKAEAGNKVAPTSNLKIPVLVSRPYSREGCPIGKPTIETPAYRLIVVFGC